MPAATTTTAPAVEPPPPAAAPARTELCRMAGFDAALRAAVAAAPEMPDDLWWTAITIEVEAPPSVRVDRDTLLRALCLADALGAAPLTLAQRGRLARVRDELDRRGA